MKALYRVWGMKFRILSSESYLLLYFDSFIKNIYKKKFKRCFNKDYQERSDSNELIKDFKVNLIKQIFFNFRRFLFYWNSCFCSNLWPKMQKTMTQQSEIQSIWQYIRKLWKTQLTLKPWGLNKNNCTPDFFCWIGLILYFLFWKN